MRKGVEKFSLSKCKTLLKKAAQDYTDEEIIAMRDFFYRLAEIAFGIYQRDNIRQLELEAVQPNPEGDVNLNVAA